MLEFRKVKNPDQIRDCLKIYDPLKDTWIVSDLKSKQEIQQESIARHGFYTDDAIMRVSDFWRLWIRRLQPGLHVVSADFIRALVQHFVDTHGEKLEITDSEVSTLNSAVQEFAPVILHPQSREILQEWLASQVQQKKWQRWYQLADVCLNYIVFDQKALDSKWCAAFLQSLDLDLLKWDRRIFVDLGSELSTIEMGLFKHFSLSQDVTILTPEPDWRDRFPHLLNTYQENFGYGNVTESAEAKEQALPPENFVRLSTQLSEVKFAVAKVREWADSGISLENIALVSSEIETYWPVLHFYLEQEGIPCRKDVVASLNSLGDVQNLLAALKNLSDDVSWDSLEKNFFGKEPATAVKFEKFKALFYQLYDQEDLQRDQKIQSLFYRKVDFKAGMDRDEFLSFLIRVWIDLPQSNNKSELFEILFKDLLGQSLSLKMKFSRWVQFLKHRLSHKEVKISRHGSGLHVESLMSAHLLQASHRIYLGLNDEFFHKKQNFLMPSADALTLKNQFDLAVEIPEESHLDFNLRWQASAESKITLYTSAHLGFANEPLNAALFFIENSPASAITVPGLTRADELQKSASLTGKRLIQDIQGYSETLPSEVFKKLSVSDIENYASCSFRLLASKGFRLRDLPQVAVDLDPRQKGSLAHELFDHCIQQMQKNEFSEDALSVFLDETREKLQIYRQQPELWRIQKGKLLVLAKKFRQFEQERLKHFEVQTEKSVEMYFDAAAGQFSLTPSEGAVGFSVRMDRIDTHKTRKYAIVYDYKSSAFQVSNFAGWISENQFQMLLYLLALELTLPPEIQARGALYYQYKTFDLKKGLIDENVGQADFGLTKRNRSLISEAKYEEFRKQFVLTLSELLKKLQNSEFTTMPAELETCNDCDWRKLCRASHLM